MIFQNDFTNLFEKLCLLVSLVFLKQNGRKWIESLPQTFILLIPISWHPDGVYLRYSHRSRLFWKVASIFMTGSTLKCRNALTFDFTSLTHLYFFVALGMQILEFCNAFVFSVRLQEVIGKILIDFYVRARILWITLCISNLSLT